MIWPSRALAIALLVPALLSLGLFVSEVPAPALVALDVLLVVLALVDLATLLGAGRFRVERRCGQVGSLGEPQEVELTIANLGRLGRIFRARDDVPESFTADPTDFLVRVPAGGHAVLWYTAQPRRRGTYAFHGVDALVYFRHDDVGRGAELALELAALAADAGLGPDLAR